MIERNALPMINTGEVTALARWIDRLPDEITRQRPSLILAYTWALIVTNRLDLAKFWLEESRQLLDQHEKQTATAPILDEPGAIDGDEKTDLSFLRGGLALCESYLAMASGDMERAAELSQQATSYFRDEGLYYSSTYFRSIVALDDSISSILSGDTQKAIESLRAANRIARQANNQFVMIIAGCGLADMLALQGRLSKAWETYQRVQNWAQRPEGKPLPLVGLVDMGLGEILLEHDLLEEARDYLERGIRITRSMWYIGSLHGVIALARLRQAMGDIPGTLEVIEEAARMALSTDASEWDEVVAPAVAVRLALQRDDLASAEQWWKKGGFPDLNTPIALEKYPYHVYEYLLLTQAKFLLVKGSETGKAGDLQQAAELLMTLMLAAERYQRVTSQIEIFVLLAMVQSALGEEGAENTLLRALALGEPEGYRRVYLDDGWRLGDLLRQCRFLQQKSGSHLPSVAFIDSLLEAIQHTATGRESDDRPVELRASPTTARLEDGFPISLSAREMEVLALIAEGKSNQEISAELYLALNTVKRHAYNIFTKLEVKKRTQAVSRARQLGLIP
jgi:LuxR family maltose regulon positive regulatory protein